MLELRKITSSIEETMSFGTHLGERLPSGSVVLLYGDLGMGKTTLVRGVARGLHIDEKVQSPTFNIMKLYLKGDRPLIHIDAYRLNEGNSDIGLEEYIGYEAGLTFIEWPMYIKNLLPKDVIEVHINYATDNKREFVITGNDEIVKELM